MPELTRSVAAELSAAGFVAPEDDGAELVRAADGDLAMLHDFVARRIAGEPLPWITGRTMFAGIELAVDPGVYVPREHTAVLARLAVGRLPTEGVAVDLCTGCGAVAAFLGHHRPRSRVVATDIDARAIACARTNGVDALRGDLDDPLPVELAGRVDVLVAVAPYVPEDAMQYLPRDVTRFEPLGALAGGSDGLEVVRRIVDLAPRWLAPAGALVVELGGDQADTLSPRLHASGFTAIEVVTDDDGDVRGVVTTRRAAAADPRASTPARGSRPPPG